MSRMHSLRMGVLLFIALLVFLPNSMVIGGDGYNYWKGSNGHWTYSRNVSMQVYKNGNKYLLLYVGEMGPPAGYLFIPSTITGNCDFYCEESFPSYLLYSEVRESENSAPTGFTISMSGDLTAPGSGGVKPTWSAGINVGTGSGTFFIKYEWVWNTPYENAITVPLGGGGMYSSFYCIDAEKNTWGSGAADWTLSGPSGNMDLSQDFGYCETGPLNATGAHTITATSTEATGLSDSATITVVGVKSISAKTSEETVTSEVETPTGNETLSVPVGSDAITVKAVSEPADKWPYLYPIWNGDAENYWTRGLTSYKFKPTTAGITTISASCGNTKALKIAVVEVLSITGYTDYGSVTSTKESPGINETIYIPVGSNIIFEATPNPDAEWPSGFPLWLSGGFPEVGPAYSFTPDAPGEYTVQAFCGEDYKSIKVMAVELSTSIDGRTVKSVTDSPGEDESVLIDAPNTNPHITAGTLTFTVTPEPGPDLPTDYPKWTVNGISVQAGGETYEFSAAGRSVGKYTVAVECGIAIDVYVTRCQAIIRVHEPSAGSGVPMDYFSYANYTYSVGHATAEVAILPRDAAKIKPFSTTYANMQVGISSANKRDLIIYGISDGAFHAPDSLGALTAADLIVVDIASAQKGIALIEQYVARSPSYVLANYLYYDSLPPYSSTQAVCSNCATIAKRIASTAGLTVPSAYGSWRGTVGGIRTTFEGDSPGFLGPRL